MIITQKNYISATLNLDPNINLVEFYRMFKEIKHADGYHCLLSVRKECIKRNYAGRGHCISISFSSYITKADMQYPSLDT